VDVTNLPVGHPVESLRVENRPVQIEDDMGDGLHWLHNSLNEEARQDS
jgi:hypothetical protein